LRQRGGRLPPAILLVLELTLTFDERVEVSVRLYLNNLVLWITHLGLPTIRLSDLGLKITVVVALLEVRVQVRVRVRLDDLVIVGAEECVHPFSVAPAASPRSPY